MQTYEAHACGWSRHQPPATLLRYGAIRIFRVLRQPPASALNTFHQSSCLRRASTTFPRNIYTRNLPFFQAPLSFRKNSGQQMKSSCSLAGLFQRAGGGFPNSSPASLWPHHSLSLKGPPSNAVLSERRPSPFSSSLPRMHGRCSLQASSGKRATGTLQEHPPMKVLGTPAATLPCRTEREAFRQLPHPVLQCRQHHSRCRSPCPAPPRHAGRASQPVCFFRIVTSSIAAGYPQRSETD